ncbi:transmembrane domain protein [Frog virus 3]|uniref:Uncharacterized protein 011R n=6 Tax=Ranavirus rana1 TaxID=3391521 RepID=011R_FRG3G|nr:hypothetical protein FV3gorf11R [Frog virus 3]Q6GZW4.1 RecName: Full=Uncharacterized protein 011R [Frog virus 3 (isolate Goorha)]ABB92277.1 hypothetical protein [Tiger frog virus]AWU46770.1 hypothetical protein [Terrapene carolina carolina ranavirus]AWU46865.1 hypothetical protein [Trioceros melleri ranavirus]QYJ57754.1 hypothetical protein [Stickleback virus]QYJ57849.1 hypothetical protein [Tadpole virus 2]WBG67474.1 hypothetical protein [Terrapene mexicana triunguis ranavirus 1]WBY5117
MTSVKTIAMLAMLVIVAALIYMGYRTFTSMQSKLNELESRVNAPQLRPPVMSPIVPLNFIESEDLDKELD